MANLFVLPNNLSFTLKKLDKSYQINYTESLKYVKDKEMIKRTLDNIQNYFSDNFNIYTNILKNRRGKYIDIITETNSIDPFEHVIFGFDEIMFNAVTHLNLTKMESINLLISFLDSISKTTLIYGEDIEEVDENQYVAERNLKMEYKRRKYNIVYTEKYNDKKYNIERRVENFKIIFDGMPDDVSITANTDDPLQMVVKVTAKNPAPYLFGFISVILMETMYLRFISTERILQVYTAIFPSMIDVYANNDFIFENEIKT